MKKYLSNDAIIFFLISVITIFLLSWLSDILMPFYIGLFVAYLLDPVVDWLEKKNINRTIGSTFILIVFTMLIMMIFLLIVPILVIQVKNFLNEFPALTDKINKNLTLGVEYIQKRIYLVNPNEAIFNFDSKISVLITNTLKNLISSSLAIFNSITLLLITPIVSWYFLKDWDKISAKFLGLISKKYEKKLLEYSKNINNILDSYLRGQLIISLLLVLYYFLAFFILQLNYSLFIALFAGLLSFIPILGLIISFLVTSILAYLQFVDVYFLLYLVIVFSVGHLLESNFFTPKLVGKKLGLHPLAVLFSIFVFGGLFGIVGIIFAIPVTSIIILIFKRNFISK